MLDYMLDYMLQYSCYMYVCMYVCMYIYVYYEYSIKEWGVGGDRPLHASYTPLICICTHTASAADALMHLTRLLHASYTPTRLLHTPTRLLHASYTHTIGRGRPHASTRIFTYLYKSIYYK